MPFATVGGFGSAATILAAHVSSYVGGPGQLMCIRHYAVSVRLRTKLKTTNDIMQVILDTRPSRFSACNIEKLGVAWGRG